jgi:hypothetical protein
MTPDAFPILAHDGRERLITNLSNWPKTCQDGAASDFGFSPPIIPRSFRQRFGFAAGQGRKTDTARDGGLSALPS